MRTIIGLHGFARTGKDTVGKILVNDYGYERLSFAAPVYQGLLKLNPYIYHEPRWLRLSAIVLSMGWDRAKNLVEVRELLQRFGTEAGRNIHGEDCWVNIAMQRIDSVDTNIVMTDVRFPNEAAAIRKIGGYVIKITRPGFGPINDHVSDSGVRESLIDYHIDNSSTSEQLKMKVAHLLVEIARRRKGSYE